MQYSIVNLKSGRAVLRPLAAIQATPWAQRARKYGRSWAWGVTKGQRMIHEQYPDLVPELQRLFSQPVTVEMLLPVVPNT
jgi:hypothetical protein